MTEELNGCVIGIYIANDPNSILSNSIEKIEVSLEGFTGDKHSGWTKPSDGRTKFYPRGTTIRNSRQVSIVSEEELGEVARLIKVDIVIVKPEWLGANLLIGGIPNLTGLKPNTRFFFSGGVVLLITSDNLPCSLMTEEIMKHFPDRPELKNEIISAAMTRRGLVAVVESPGIITRNEKVRVVKAR
ncbi:MAG: MOSC domain-containing protein [Leptolinea sp.]|jgi:hypothetical protein|nr:MOSC domain-containing protein [Leptolinea sp.]